MLLEVQFDPTVIADLRLDAKELAAAMQYTAQEVTRSNRVAGTRELRAEVAGLSVKRARTRVRSYRDGGGTWLGGNDLAATTTLGAVQQGRRPRSTAPRNRRRSRYGRGGRPVSIEGRRLPHGWVWLKRDLRGPTRRAGLAFERPPGRERAMVVQVDIDDEVRDVHGRLAEMTPEKVDEVFRTKALQIVQTRSARHGR